MALAGTHHLTEAGEDSPEHGWVQIICAFLEPDAPAREELLRDAIAVGRRFRDPDVELFALAYLGGVLVMIDRVEEGLALTDEALAAACAGELAEVATVDSIFCGFFWACELVTQHFDRGMPERRATALIRLADLRLRQGRLEEAAQLLQGLEPHI